ncbi:MAG: ABC transporter substrate-binding protein [Paracoccaceae bacterium]
MIARIIPAATLALGLASAARAQEPIVFGEINAFETREAVAGPYRQGMTLALEEIEEDDGIDGRPLEALFRAAADPAEARRQAGLLREEGARLVTGGLDEEIARVLSDWAGASGTVYLATLPGSDALVWSDHEPHVFRLGPSHWMHAAMLAEAAAEEGATRFLAIVADDADGLAAAAAFEQRLVRADPEASVVGTIALDAEAPDLAAAAEERARFEAEAAFVALEPETLARLAAAPEGRALLDGLQVYAPRAGDPETLSLFGETAPTGWVVTGYPWYAIDDYHGEAFVEAYEDRWDEAPTTGALIGYTAVQAVEAALERAEAKGGEAADALRTAFEGLVVRTPVGPITFRELDHQATMGAWVGRLAEEDGEIRMTDTVYRDGKDHLPSDEETLGRVTGKTPTTE